MVIILVGGQWGDEGKGKVIDYLAEKADVVIRSQGGNNAGHTVITEHGEFKFQLMPSGILYPECVCIIGNGVGGFNDFDIFANGAVAITSDNKPFERGMPVILKHLRHGRRGFACAHNNSAAFWKRWHVSGYAV